MKITAAVARFFGVVLITMGLAAATAAAADLSQPVTLVATPVLQGSPFVKTVLIAAPLPNGMHIGFVVNQPSEITLAAIFPEDVATRKVVDPIYIGGPMLMESLYAVVRTPPADTENLLEIMPGVVLVMDGPAIDRIIETTPNEARYFAGLVLWQPGELDEEVRASAWDVSPADADAVFSAHPEKLWETLSRRGVRVEARARVSAPRV